MSTPYIGEIRPVAYNFAPMGWALCNGQTLSVNQNQPLFAVIGFTYGGDGKSSFALPDLRGRAPMHQGQGPGLSARPLGEAKGEAEHTLTTAEMPAHSHTPSAYAGAATTSDPTNATWATTVAPSYASVPNGVLDAATTGVAGNSQPHENRPPYLVVNWMIALNGVFPSGN